jgi:hypothetical protein
MLTAAALAIGSGCARSDWIERTLVTVDVTGTWEGSAPTVAGQSWLRLILEQHGARVTGSVESSRGAPQGGSIARRAGGHISIKSLATTMRPLKFAAARSIHI